MERQPALYILSDAHHGTLFVGITGDLVGAVLLHRLGLVPGCTARYRVNRLVYFERIADFPTALRRERTVRDASRPWKLATIARFNPDWRDLWREVATHPV